MFDGLFRPAEAVFRARSVALVGASETAGLGMARHVYRNLEFAGFPTELYLINPRREEIWGRPCYPNFGALPKSVDLAITIIPGSEIPAILEDGAKHGLRAALIFAARFGEDGDAEGLARAKQLQALSARTGLRICGPNCQGTVAARERYYFYPSSRVRNLPPGPVGAIFQSGGTFMYWLQHGAARGLGFSYAATSGNEIDLDLADYINFLVEDPSTRLIACMVEGVRRPDAFMAAAEKALRVGKPILAVKIGRSERGAKTAASHTGALAGDDRLFDAVCRRYGIIRCHTLDQMLETALALQSGRTPRTDKTAAVFYSGGAKGLFLDYAEEAKTVLATFSNETVAALAPICDPGMQIENPLDAGAGSSATFEKFCGICQIAAADPDVGILAIHAQLPLSEADGLLPAPFRALAESTGKPILAVSRMAQNVTEYSRAFQQEAGIPFLQGLHHAAHAINAMVAFGKARSRRISALPSPQVVRTSDGADAILAKAGIRQPESRIVSTPLDAGIAADEIGYPVAVKILSPQASHKTEIGGVTLGLTGPRQVSQAAEAMAARLKTRIPDAHVAGYLVQRMVAGLEVLVGFRNDPGYGPFLTLGLGGIAVEAFHDISCRMLPVSRDDIIEMIECLRSAALFKSFRGQPPRDVPALVQAVEALSSVFLAHRNSLSDLEINPLMVGSLGEGVYAVDVRIVSAAPVSQAAGDPSE